tara:strand:+ start:3014 stop:3388 length:375 start_codon:yes stop_codon:yes gene_type:complete
MIIVTCGILYFKNKILITQRNKNKKEFPLFWEFPGGKANINETIIDCISREIKEELNLYIDFKEIIFIKNNYLNKYNLYYCKCNIINIDNIKMNNEIKDYKLVNKEELINYNLIPGDKEIINLI